MKEIVVISGKGGTGKTSITASLAYLAKQEVIVADCDVDAADLHLLLSPEETVAHDFYSGYLAQIDNEKCTGCNRCKEVCRFGAIEVKAGDYKVLPLECEGCGYCDEICPVDAIEMEEQNIGEWYISKTKVDSSMVHASLQIGAENSGKLVTRVKNEATNLAEEKSLNKVLVDGSPGIGCPVIASLSGADYVLLVAEPTNSGFHDMKRVYNLVEKFDIPAGCVINKADLNVELTTEIKNFIRKNEITNFGEIPYDDAFTEQMTEGKTIVEAENNEIKDQLVEIWNKIKSN